MFSFLFLEWMGEQKKYHSSVFVITLVKKLNYHTIKECTLFY